MRRKLAAYLADGARLGWLLLPRTRSVEVWTPTPARALASDQRLEAGQEFPGLTLDLAGAWGGLRAALHNGPKARNRHG